MKTIAMYLVLTIIVVKAIFAGVEVASVPIKIHAQDLESCVSVEGECQMR